MLCDIYISLGENHLCHTCKEFPRITQDYTAFCEHTLSFACPEAARLMLESDFDTGFATDIPQDLQTDYSTTEMNFLLSARKRTFEILSDCKMSLSERLCRLLAFNERVQNMLDDEILISRLCRQMNIKSKAAKMRHSFLICTKALIL